MKIRFVRSGGFAGISTRLDLDTAKLPAAKRAEIEKLVDEAGFFALHDVPSGSTPDSFQYDITIEDHGKEHQVRAGDRSAPAALRQVIDRLMEESRRKAKS